MMRPDRVAELRRATVGMFYHGFDNYMHIAFPEDEVCEAPPGARAFVIGWPID